MELSKLFDPSAVKERGNGKEQTHEPISVVRVFAQTPITLKQLEEEYKQLTGDGELFFTGVIFAQKSSESKPSAGLLIPLGGEKSGKETVIVAGEREVAEESTLLTLAWRPALETDEQSDGLDGQDAPIPEYKEGWQPSSFRYKIPDYPESREVNLLVLPFRSADFSLHQPREGERGSEDKIEQLVILSPQQVRVLIEENHVRVDGESHSVVGHLSLSGSTDTIEIEPEEDDKRKLILDEALSQINSFEARIRESVLEEINRIRVWEGRAAAPRLSCCNFEEIKRGFVAAQMRLGFSAEKKSDERGEQVPIREDAKLNLVHYAMGIPPELISQLLLSVPRSSLIKDFNLLKRSFKNSVLGLLPKEEREKIDNNLKMGGDCNFFDFLRKIWEERILSSPPGERRELILQANRQFTEDLARRLNVPTYIIERARDVTLEFLEEFTGHSIQSLEKFRGMPQAFRLLNEVSNATPFELMAMSMGLHPNVDISQHQDTETVRLLRSESMIASACFLSAIEAVKQLSSADNKVFEACLDSFLVFPPQKDILNLGDGMFLPVFHRTLKLNRSQLGELWDQTAESFGVKLEAGEEIVEIHLIVDERRKKQEISRLRKNLQDSDKDDNFSTNLVLADDNFQACGFGDVHFRLILAEKVGELLVLHIQKSLASEGLKAGIKSGTLDTSRLEVASLVGAENQGQSGGLSEKLSGGKRAGSQGQRILREKMIIEIENTAGGSGTTLQELNIYPFESFDMPIGTCFQQSGFWAANDKWRDDLEGKYNAMRLIMRYSQHPTYPSLLELVAFPPLNRQVQEQLWSEQVQSRKKQ